MENMERLNNLFGGIYKGRKVLVTGHTGFKGSWLALWLKMMGAEVFGYSLASEYEENHIGLLNLDIDEKIADLRDLDILKNYINNTS